MTLIQCAEVLLANVLATLLCLGVFGLAAWLGDRQEKRDDSDQGGAP